MKESETEKENPPSTISKLSNISNTENTSLNSNDLRLSCPNCDLIPALFFDFNSKNIYQISAACENKHLITNMPVKEYYDKCMKSKNSKDTFNDFICFKHNANFNSFCKTCRKNICKECSDSEHKNHFISQFYELLPSNEEIIQLKNSIDNEINDVNVFLIETFNNWIKEIKSKFDILIENIKAKNKLYNFIINFYETKEFNYQNIYNIKIISQNQLKRNPLTQEIQTLKNIITRNEALLNSKNKNKDEYEESKNKYLKLKSSQLLKILNILNSDVNSNYKFTPYDSAEKTLENFLEDKNDSSSVLSEYVVINPYNKSYNDISTNNINESINSEKNSDSKLKESLTINEKLELANEIKLTKRKLNQNISQESIVHCLVVLKDYKGKLTNRFAVGLENGNINIYYLDSKTNNIFLDFEIKEHTKAVNYITCLHDGRLLTCSYDNTMKVIEETISYSYLLSFWKRYYVIQTLTKPIIDKYVFQPVSVVEMSNNTLVSGDWKNITIWKLIKKEEKRHKKREKINFSFDILDYNRNKYNYYYEIYKEINISTSVTSLLNIDNKTFISAHYGPGIVTFYNIYDESKKSIEKIKCVDSATQCMTLIEVKKAESNWQKDKIIIVGGYKCIYLLSAKDQNLIDKITLPGNDYIKCLINSGMTNISNGFICGGLFNQYTFDLVHYNTKSHFGFNELVVNEVSRIKDTSKGAINSIIYIKKNLSDESFNQKNIIIVTGGNEQTIKTFTGIEDDEEED
jgi:hypothetical protein